MNGDLYLTLRTPNRPRAGGSVLVANDSANWEAGPTDAIVDGDLTSMFPIGPAGSETASRIGHIAPGSIGHRSPVRAGHEEP